MKYLPHCSREQALQSGYTIDDCTYPPVAYKGVRYETNDYFFVPTAKEQECLDRLELFLKNYGTGKGRTHVLKTSKGCSCLPDERCNICDYGLGICLICNAAESQMDQFTCEEYKKLQQ